METDDRRRVPAEALKAFGRAILEKVDVPAEDARIVAEVLVAADLRGVESHGMARLRGYYVDRLRGGGMPARPEVRVLHETPVTAVLDAGGGLGHPPAYRAMQLALDKAARFGAGFVTVRNSNHFGIAGYYAMLALERNCIGLAMTNGSRWVVPTFGRDPMLGTNPIAVAVPAGQAPAFVLDTATSTAAVGKVEVAEREGRPIPLGWATDKAGQPATDPGPFLQDMRAALGGGMLPLGGAGETLGGHKGYGLAAWVDLFCGPLAGAGYADQIVGLEASSQGRPGILGHFFGAWQVEAFRPLADFAPAVDDWQARLKGSRKADGHDRIYVAGEKEHAEAERRRRDGIPLHPAVLADLQALGAEFGLTLGAGG